MMGVRSTGSRRDFASPPPPARFRMLGMDVLSQPGLCSTIASSRRSLNISMRLRRRALGAVRRQDRAWRDAQGLPRARALGGAGNPCLGGPALRVDAPLVSHLHSPTDAGAGHSVSHWARLGCPHSPYDGTVCNHSATQMLGPRWVSLGRIGKMVADFRCKSAQSLWELVTISRSLGLDGQAIQPA